MISGGREHSHGLSDQFHQNNFCLSRRFRSGQKHPLIEHILDFCSFKNNQSRINRLFLFQQLTVQPDGGNGIANLVRQRSRN